jgi:hypothetical protein
MPLMTQPSSAAKTSLAYITLGSLLIVWTGIWFFYLHTNPDGVQLRTWYICYGLLCTGGVLLVIGLAVGQIGRRARHAELPPPKVVQQQAKTDQTAAARPVVVPPVASAPAGGQPILTPTAPVPPPSQAIQPVVPAPRV